MKMNPTKKRGSALLLVMMITAGIITVIFGTQRIALVQFSQTLRDEDNYYALYAAKAGVEDGLMRYRYNRDVETPDGKVFGFNVTKGESSGLHNADESGDFGPTEQFYDLGIKYRNNSITNVTIALDDTRELTGFPTSETPYYLKYNITFGKGSQAGAPCSVQFQRIGKGVGATGIDTKTIIGNSTDVVNSTTADHIYLNPATSEAISSLKIRATQCPVTLSVSTEDVSGNQSNLDFDSLTTTITSTGYYGSAKRTLIANVDRTTGVLIGIYDFTLYGGDKGSILPKQ